MRCATARASAVRVAEVAQIVQIEQGHAPVPARPARCRAAWPGRAAAAAGAHRRDLPGGQGEMRAGRRADREVRAVQYLAPPVIREGVAARGHDGLAVAVAAQGHSHRAALRPQGGGRKAAHLAVADDDRAPALERAEERLRAARADLGRGRRHAGQPCLGAHALARGHRAAEQRIQHRVRAAGLARERSRVLDLRDDLVVPEIWLSSPAATCIRWRTASSPVRVTL